MGKSTDPGKEAVQKAMREPASMVEILSFRLVDGDKPLKALADIEAWGWRVFGLKVIQSETKPLRVFPPHNTWLANDGTPRYQEVIEFPPAVFKAINEVVLERFHEEVEKKRAEGDS